MIRLCAFLIFLFSAGKASDETSLPTALTFRATVEEQLVIFDYSGPIILTHFDPHFVIKLRILSACPEATELTVASVQAFGIHSPTRLFAPNKPEGKMFDFTMTREVRNGKTVYRALRIKNSEN